MKEWKLRQTIFHRTVVPSDRLGIDVRFDVVDMPKPHLKQCIIEYFTLPNPQIVYPAKSYAVAIIYARLLEKYFEEQFWTVLDDPELLFSNDPYFVPYSMDRDVYDAVVGLIPQNIESITYAQVQTTISYFHEEFLIGK